VCGVSKHPLPAPHPSQAEVCDALESCVFCVRLWLGEVRAKR
jgi:hypothetical protein